VFFFFRLLSRLTCSFSGVCAMDIIVSATASAARNLPEKKKTNNNTHVETVLVMYIFNFHIIVGWRPLLLVGQENTGTTISASRMCWLFAFLSPMLSRGWRPLLHIISLEKDDTKVTICKLKQQSVSRLCRLYIHLS